ncbi:MAG: hypothetical protein Q8O34_08070 [Rhodocyclaceae bacterium]|nr:hypothetical protein [Rhodocyclaceae bacterium]
MRLELTKGRKQHIAVDTMGFILAAIAHSAGIQYRTYCIGAAEQVCSAKLDGNFILVCALACKVGGVVFATLVEEPLIVTTA